VLPEAIDGIYLGGGFPEKFAKALSENKILMKAIKNFADQGGMIYGECGGLMYLSKAIIDFDNNQYPMIGILDLAVEMTSRLQHFGYVAVKYQGKKFRAHEFHRSRVIQNNNEMAYKINKFSKPKETWNGGYTYKNVLAGYPHVHFYSNFEFANALINQIKKSKEPSEIWDGGYTYKNVLAGYPHVHFYSNFEFANTLINQIKKSKEV